MMRTLLVRGMTAGIVAGLATLVFATVFGEPGVNGGIAHEEHAAGAGHSHEVELVSRGVQSTVGLGTAAIVYGAAIGGIFAVVYALLHGRVSRMSPRSTAGTLALAGFVVIFVVPFVKYPANPPGANDPGTISERTGLYLTLLLFSVAVAVAAFALVRQLGPRIGGWNAALVGGGTYLAVVSAVAYSMPSVAETPADFPATVLYEFRTAALGGQLVLWAILGLMFGALAAKQPAAGSNHVRQAPRPDVVGAARPH